MATKKEINQFIKSQKSLQFYKKTQTALKSVLISMNDKTYKKATKNLIIMALHEGALGQVMHFPTSKKFKIMQLIIPKKIPLNVLKFVIAHEFGHVLQERNWKKSDGHKLEPDADNKADIIGFTKTKTIAKWMKDYREHNR